MIRALSLVGAPSSAGAYAPGQEKAPAAFRRHGLVPALTESGLHLNDRGDTPGFRWRPDHQRPKAMNLHAVQRTAAAVADKVGGALSNGEAGLVLGGDCTVELLIHLDVDVLNFTDFPIAENTRRCDGLSFEALSAALAPLVAAPNVLGLFR